MFCVWTEVQNNQLFPTWLPAMLHALVRKLVKICQYHEYRFIKFKLGGLSLFFKGFLVAIQDDKVAQKREIRAVVCVKLAANP